jgi:hypothetical protein
VVEQEWGVDRVRPNPGDVLSRGRRWDMRLVAGTASIIRSLWGATEDAMETGSPQEADVLAESLPFDPAALDRAIEHCLDQIDAFEALADLLRSDGPWPWLAGAVVASAAGVVAHRRARRPRSEPITLVDDEGTISPWLLELTSKGQDVSCGNDTATRKRAGSSSPLNNSFSRPMAVIPRVVTKSLSDEPPNPLAS